MNIHDLLEEANLRYPIGTTYWNLNLAGERSSTYEGAEPHTRKNRNAADVEMMDFQGYGPVIKIGYMDGFVYSGGKWAEIVSQDYQIY